MTKQKFGTNSFCKTYSKFKVEYFKVKTLSKQLLVAFAFVFNFYAVFAQIPIDVYRTEISNLKSERAIEAYWADLHKADQDSLLPMSYKNITLADSISTSLMLRTALMFEIHGDKSYRKNNRVPILNFTHNQFGIANIAFWPIIVKCVEVGGYQLEAVANNFYGYSLLNQDHRYGKLVEKLNSIQPDPKLIVQHLNDSYENQKKLRRLKTIKIIGKWFNQSFKNQLEENCFEFVKLSDNSLYHKRGEYLQKLLLVEGNKNTKVYRIENEPFGWCYELSSKNELKLYDDKNEVLIDYSFCK